MTQENGTHTHTHTQTMIFFELVMQGGRIERNLDCVHSLLIHQSQRNYVQKCVYMVSSFEVQCNFACC